MAPLNVLAVVVGAAKRAGGTAAFVGESAQALEALGERVTILATDIALSPGGWTQRQRRARPEDRHASLTGGNVRVYPARFPRRLARSPALARAARSLAPASDIVHLHNLWQLPQHAGYRAARAAGVPYVVSTHGALDPYIRQHGRARKRLSMALYQDRLLREAALIHVTTQTEAESIADVAEGVPRAVVPCGINVAEYSDLPPRVQFRRERLGGFDGPVVLFLGRIAYKKGLDVLVRAFAGARAGRDCRLVIAGPDDEGQCEALRRLAAEQRVADAVVFPGPLYGQDRLAALASADVWALTSQAENFGIAVVEAMAAGCPVLVSTEVGVAGDVAAARAGVVVAPTPEQVADALAGLLDDEAQRRRLGDAGRALATRYDWSVVAPRLVEMYRQVLAG